LVLSTICSIGFDGFLRRLVMSRNSRAVYDAGRTDPARPDLPLMYSLADFGFFDWNGSKFGIFQFPSAAALVAITTTKTIDTPLTNHRLNIIDSFADR
jgi:hypothetical protein